MTRGSWVHDDLGDHFASCAQCRAVDPESKRVRHAQPGQVSEKDVPAEVLSALCPNGRLIYRAYLRWLAEPE